MKYLTTLIIVVVVLTSCKKKYTCTCYALPDTTDVRTFTIKAKSSSKARCIEDCPPPEVHCEIE